MTGIEKLLPPFEIRDIPEEPYKMEPFAMLILGGAGDLSQRMLMPAIFHLFMDGELPEDFFIAGAGLPAMTNNEYRELMTGAMERAEEDLNKEKWLQFKERLYYVPGEFRDDATYEEIRAIATELGSKCGNNIIYYLAVAPNFTDQIVEKLNQHNLCKGTFRTKLILEKPFGRDRESAIKLNDILTRAFDEQQLYRIDHFLGKETVQNILFFRFSNLIFEELWSNHHIDNIQVTVAEKIGMENRGKFYEQTGIVRDMIQNHMLQLIALIAMEPPATLEPDAIRDEKLKIFKSVKIPDA